MAQRQNRFTYPEPTARTVPLVPMITYDNYGGPHQPQQEAAEQSSTGERVSMFGFDAGHGGPEQPRTGVHMNFSGPVHVHVDNMYVYDGEQLRRAIQLTQRANMLENGMPIAAAQPTARAPRKRPPPKKKVPESDQAQTTNGVGDGSGTPPHSD